MIVSVGRRSSPLGGIVLPAASVPRARRPVDRATLDDALEAGRSLGFVARDPAPVDPGPLRRRPGPRRGELRDRLSVPGPRRVTDAFRAFCTRHGLTHWQGLERLMRAGPAAALARAGALSDGLGTGAEERGDADRLPVAATVPMPASMRAWIEARGRGVRYLDAADYVRDLIRRDQRDDAAILALEAALAAAVEMDVNATRPALSDAASEVHEGATQDSAADPAPATGAGSTPDGRFDVAAFLARRQPDRP